MIRINKAADLDDLFGGQVDFEVCVTSEWVDGLGNSVMEIIGAGHTVAEAVADARETIRAWE